MLEHGEQGQRRRVRRLCAAMGLPMAALMFPGCASLSGDTPSAFEPSVQEELIRQHERESAASAAMPNDPEPQSVVEWLRKGDAEYGDAAYAAAMWNYLRAHELDPDDPAPIARMGGLHLMVDAERAESIFRKLVAEHPEDGAAHAGLGLVQIERGDFEGARDLLTRAVELSPRSAAAYSALGVCLDRLERHEEAQAAYLRATALHPKFYEALNNLGVSYLTTGRFDAAAEVLGRAAALQSRDPAVFNNLGLALGRMKHYDDALDAFRRGGSEQAARNNLGYVSYLNGDYDRALAEYEQALLVGGDQKLLVLRNLRVAMRADSERNASDD
jgi:Flp pilus assembly protein TadD